MAKDNEAAENTEENAGGSGSKIVIIAVVVLLVGIGLGYLTAVVLVGDSGGEATVKTKVVIPDSVDGMPNYDQVKIEGVTINPKPDPKAKRPKMTILATAFVFDIKPKGDGAAEFAEKEMQIRDLVKSYLRNRTVNFFRDPKTEEEIKKQLKKRINRKLEKSEVVKVYIPDFILN